MRRWLCTVIEQWKVRRIETQRVIALTRQVYLNRTILENGGWL